MNGSNFAPSQDLMHIPSRDNIFDDFLGHLRDPRLSSYFTEIIYIFNIFDHFITFEPRICEVWKGNIWELNISL